MTNTSVTLYVNVKIRRLTYDTDSYKKGGLQTGKQGWGGISHAGGMANALLLVAWTDGTKVKTAFTFAK